jgi:hypothetical protein
MDKMTNEKKPMQSKKFWSLIITMVSLAGIAVFCLLSDRLDSFFLMIVVVAAMFSIASVSMAYNVSQAKQDAQLRLDGSKGEQLQLVVQDDLTGLDTFKIVAQAELEERTNQDA